MIPVNTPLLIGNEKKYLVECIESGWISSEGPFVKRFEKEMAAYVNRNYGIAVSNGTAALEIAMKAIGIQKGDEVIMPTFTIISPAQAVSKLGAKPVLVDSDPDTWNMDISQIEGKITVKTKAIVAVHIYGLPVDMDPILEICKKHDLILIEDAAEMHGQKYKGKRCGSFGDISIFSFYPNKHITTGEGGMIVTDDENLMSRCKSLRNLCFLPEKRFVHEEIGWNYRMTNLQAAIGVAQLEQLESFIEKKRWIGRLYNSLLNDLSDKVQLPCPENDYAVNIYWVYGMVLKDAAQLSAKNVMEQLAEKGIGSRPFFFPIHRQPVYNNLGWYLDENLPVSERMAEKGFYIPSGLGITEEDIQQVAQTLRAILSK